MKKFQVFLAKPVKLKLPQRAVTDLKHTSTGLRLYGKSAQIHFRPPLLLSTCYVYVLMMINEMLLQIYKVQILTSISTNILVFAMYVKLLGPIQPQNFVQISDGVVHLYHVLGEVLFLYFGYTIPAQVYNRSLQPKSNLKNPSDFTALWLLF